MTSAVFDCMVFLQAATSDRGPAFACLELVEANQVTLYVSTPILAEVRDVLSRPKITGQFPHLTAARVDVFLQKVASMAVLVGDVPGSGLSVRDAADQPYLDLAAAVNADYLVSRDPDLLDLAAEPALVRLRPRLRVVSPPAFLAAVRPTH